MWAPTIQPEEYLEGLQNPGSSSERLWNTGSLFISPPSQREGV